MAETGLDDKAWEDVKQALEMDGWLKYLDLRGNPLSEEAIKELGRVYKRSKGLKIVDIRNIDAAEGIRPALMKAMKLRIEKLGSQGDAVQRKWLEIVENKRAIPGFPLQLLLKGSERRSKPASLSVSFTETKPRRRAQSAVRKAKPPAEKASAKAVPCRHCPSLQFQLRSALSRISHLEQELSQSPDTSKVAYGQSLDSPESLLMKAERLVTELTETLDLLDAKETTDTTRL